MTGALASVASRRIGMVAGGAPIFAIRRSTWGVVIFHAAMKRSVGAPWCKALPDMP